MIIALAIVFSVVLIAVGGATVWFAIDDYRQTPKEDRTNFFENQG